MGWLLALVVVLVVGFVLYRGWKAKQRLTPQGIQSAQDCLDAGGNNYNFCPESGVYYCNGVCSGTARCISNGNLRDGACNPPPPKQPADIKTAEDCFYAGGSNFQTCGGVNYCTGPCKGIAGCASNYNLRANACNPPVFKYTPKYQTKITSNEACRAAGGYNYGYCAQTDTHYCQDRCFGKSTCPSNTSLRQSACDSKPGPKPADIKSEADCYAAGGINYAYCPETGQHYCGWQICKGLAACPSNSSLQYYAACPPAAQDQHRNN